MRISEPSNTQPHTRVLTSDRVQACFPACCCIGFGSGIRCTIGLIAYYSNCCVCIDNSIVTPPGIFHCYPMGCNNTKSIPIVDDDEDPFANATVNPTNDIASASKVVEKTQAANANVTVFSHAEEEDNQTNATKNSMEGGATGEEQVTAATNAPVDTKQNGASQTSAKVVPMIESSTSSETKNNTSSDGAEPGEAKKEEKKTQQQQPPPTNKVEEETDAEFMQRMEDEDKVSFAAAVEEWREEKNAGRGEAKIVESGGGFKKGLEKGLEKEEKEAKKAGGENKEEEEEGAQPAANGGEDGAKKKDFPDHGLGIGPLVASMVKDGTLPKDTMMTWSSKSNDAEDCKEELM